MQISIEIDDNLMRHAMRVGGADTKKATVEIALRLLIQTRSQAGMRRFRGKVKWEGNLDVSRRARLCSLSILLLLICSLYSRAQTATSNANAAADLVPFTLDMDWTRGKPGSHYGPNFISLHTPCLSKDQSCECVAEFKVISSKENSKEFAEYVASFEHGKVPVTYDVAYGQSGFVIGARLLSVGDWKRDRFHHNDGLLGVSHTFLPGDPQTQHWRLNGVADCFPQQKP